MCEFHFGYRIMVKMAFCGDEGKGGDFSGG